jgi:hypothetical protein
VSLAPSIRRGRFPVSKNDKYLPVIFSELEEQRKEGIPVARKKDRDKELKRLISFFL